LTDGHANYGITNSAKLQQMIRAIHEKCPTLSLTAVAYGEDHNTELMKMTAEEFHTSYNIVNTVEDAAAALGDTLGAFVSTCAQNVRVTCSELTCTYGPYKNQRGIITIGDLLAGTEIVILMDAPCRESMTLTGTEVPGLTPITIEISHVDAPPGRHIDVELLRLRYRCSDILQRLRGPAPEAVRGSIEIFATDMADTAFDSNPLAEMLRAEIPTMRAGLQGHMNSQLHQHSAYIGLGRGISTQAGGTVASPFQNRTMRTITSSMRQATQAQNDPEDIVSSVPS